MKYTNLEIANTLKIIKDICGNCDNCGDCPLVYDEGDCYENYRCSLNDVEWYEKVIERLKG